MLSRVLFPTDCSEKARSLIAVLSGLDPRPTRVCCAVVVPIRGMEQPMIESHIAQARRDLEDLAAPLVDLGIDVPMRVLTGRPLPALLKTASEVDADSIVLGTYGKTPMEEVLKGSLSAELTRHSTLPVLSVRFGALWSKDAETCREIGRTVFARPLHPTDLSECSGRALDLIRNDLVGRVERIDLVHVVDDVYQPGQVHDAEVAEARAYLDEAVAGMRTAGIEATGQLVEGDPIADILRLSRECDSTCLVLGSRGKSLMREAVVGSVSQGLLRMSSKPVLVVH